MGRIKAAALVVTGILLAAPAAYATTYYASATGQIACTVATADSVGAALDKLAATIEAGTLKPVDRNGLLTKVASANGKSAQGKFDEALGLLDQISSKVSDLLNAAKPKTDELTATSITSAAYAAAQCIAR